MTYSWEKKFDAWDLEPDVFDEILNEEKELENAKLQDEISLDDLVIEEMELEEKLDYLRENDLKFMKKKEALAEHERTWQNTLNVDFDLLNDYGNIQSNVDNEELIANKNRILGTLKNYGIEIDKIMATVGPTVTLYQIVPAAGRGLVKLLRESNLLKSELSQIWKKS